MLKEARGEDYKAQKTYLMTRRETFMCAVLATASHYVNGKKKRWSIELLWPIYSTDADAAVLFAAVAVINLLLRPFSTCSPNSLSISRTWTDDACSDICKRSHQ